MLFFNRLTAVVLSAALIGPIAPLEAKNRKGDKLLTQGRAFEAKKDWDAALEAYEKALSEDPADVQYQMAATKVRFQAAQAHIEKGVKIRAQGMLGEAMLEFQKAFAINPASAAAVQEIKTTQEMIQRERLRVMQTGKESSPEERGLTPLQQMKKDQDEKLDRILTVPELKPLDGNRINLTMNSADPKLLFETVGKLAGINVLWDPEYQPPNQRPRNVVFQNSTLEEALDYLAVVTKSYWKPLSSNTIFVTNDTRNKRNDYADQVLRVFYLSNVQSAQELQEIVNAVRTVTDTQRMFPFNGQNAIVVRGEADQVALVEKIIHDLDRPRAEVVVDVIVMQTTSTYSRQLTAALAPTGLNIPANFTPRNGLQVVTDANTTGTTGTNTTGTTGTTTTTTKGTDIPLSNLGHLASSDWSTTLPSALLQAVMSDANTKVLQSPQVRTVDQAKASLRIGDKIPTATGSFQPGIGGVGINPLVNTQFQYLEVGVNVDLTPRVHENGDVSIHLEMDVSSESGTANLGGIDQPIISQKKITQDIRLRDGEVSLLGGLMQQQDTKTVTGIPGLSQIPLLRRLFTSDSISRQRSDMMIALVPHVIRRPEFSAESLRAIDVGTMNAIKLNYAPKPEETTPAAAAIVAKPEPTAAAVTAPSSAAPPASAPPATAPPATAPPATAPPITAPPVTVPGAPGAPAATQQAAQAPAGNAAARFQPAQVDTAANGAFTVALVLDRGADVGSASPMQIQFDPKLLSLQDIAPGDLMSQGGEQPVFVRNIMNDMGLATINLNRKPGAPGAAAPGTLVTLKFQAVGRGTTTVTALNVTVRNAQGMAIGSSSPQLTVNIK